MHKIEVSGAIQRAERWILPVNMCTEYGNRLQWTYKILTAQYKSHVIHKIIRLYRRWRKNSSNNSSYFQFFTHDSHCKLNFAPANQPSHLLSCSQPCIQSIVMWCCCCYCQCRRCCSHTHSLSLYHTHKHTNNPGNSMLSRILIKFTSPNKRWKELLTRHRKWLKDLW